MIGENIKRFRTLKGLSLRKFGELVGMSQTAVAKYEKNIIKPDGERLIMFAKVLECSVSDLVKDNSKRKVLQLNFRKRCSLSGKRLNILKEIINDKICNYLDVLELNNISKTRLNKYRISYLDEIEKAAIKFRKDNYINEKLSLINLCNIIENLGIIVIIIDNKDVFFDGFDGISEVVDGVPFICIASNINYYRQRFTLAHELGHLILQIDAGLNEEEVCNEFASSLLLPRKAMELEFGKHRLNISNREYEIVREEYGVSIKSIIYRLQKYGIVNANFAKLAYINYNKNLKKEEYNCSLNNFEVAKKYEQLALRLLNQEIITKSRFDELMKGWYHYD